MPWPKPAPRMTWRTAALAVGTAPSSRARVTRRARSMRSTTLFSAQGSGPSGWVSSAGMATRKASDLVVECLESEGVKHVFGIPGEETLDLNESLSRSSVEFVPVRHEQGGAYMADVWGRLTGRAGVCLGT